MLGKDHPLDDAWSTPDAASDKLRFETVAAGRERGTVLSDARLRQEHSQAYRARVDAIYDLPQCESARPEVTARGSSDQPSERPNLLDKYPHDYQRPTHDPPRVGGPHEPPEKWVIDINLDMDLPGRDVNCGECARAVHGTWHGEPAAAAAMSDPDSDGEDTPRMTEWAGLAPRRATMTEIGRHLEQLGPGSSAIVGCDWARPNTGGHWFNAVNDAGTVKAVDGQSSRVETWPPSIHGFGWDESRIENLDALFFTSDGKVV